MALAHVWYELVVQFADVGRNTTTRTYRMQSDIVTAAAAATAAANLLTDLAAVSKLPIKGYRLVDVFADSAFVGTADSGAEAEKALLLTLPIFGNPLKSGTIDVPAPVDAIMGAPNTTAYNTAVLDAPLLTAFLDNFITAGEFTLSDGEVAATSTATAGKRVSKRSTKG